MTVHTDGASRGNPGPAAIGVVIQDASGRVLLEFGEALPPTTNNVAEYTAVIRALERAEELGAGRVHCRMDSQLVVRQLNGRYRVKHADMVPLYRRVLELIQHFDEVTFEHVPREANAEADRLANLALDQRVVGEPVVSRLFQALLAGRTEEAHALLSDRFRYRRATQHITHDVQVFLDQWRRPADGWKSGTVRTAGLDIIFDAERRGEALLWICREAAGKLESLIEYRDISR